VVSTWYQKLLPYLGGAVDTFYCSANPATFRFTNSLFYDPLLAKSKADQQWPQPWNQKRSYGFNARGTRSPNPDNAWLGLGHVGETVDSWGNPIPEVLNEYVSESMVRAPADMIAIGDSLSRGVLDDLIGAIRYGGSEIPGARHNKGADIVFCDGHVEWQLQRKWVAKTGEARRRWNRDNEPHADTWDEVINGLEVVPTE
jgi:prepilin-type processing-associated H-X9-DG protein